MKRIKTAIIFIGICFFVTAMGLSSIKYEPLTIKSTIKLAVINSSDCSLTEMKLSKMNGNGWILSMFTPEISANYSFSYSSTITNDFNAYVEVPISPLFVLSNKKNIHDLKESVLKTKFLQTKMKTIDNALNLYNLLFEEQHIASVYNTIISKACRLNMSDERSKEVIENMKISLDQHLITIEEMSYDLKNMLSIPQSRNIKLVDDILSSKYFSELLRKIKYAVSNQRFPEPPNLLILDENRKILKEENAIRWISNSFSFFLNLDNIVDLIQSKSHELSYGIKMNILSVLNLFNLSLTLSNTSGIAFSISMNGIPTKNLDVSNNYSTSFSSAKNQNIQSQYKHKIVILYKKMLIYYEEYKNLLKHIPKTFTMDNVEYLSNYIANIERLSQMKSLYIQTVLKLSELLCIL